MSPDTAGSVTNPAEPLHIFTVLNTKAWHPDPNRLFAYKIKHVIWMIKLLTPFIQNASPALSCRFYCLSDVPIPALENVQHITLLKLKHPEFKGLWSKLELLSPATVEH